MSLQVWLPLTKDLRQQGLSNITVTNTGATYSSTGGKLGGYYNFDGTKYLQSNETIGEGVKELTFACWVCPGSETLTSGQWYRILGIGPHTRSQLDISSDNKFRLFVSQTGSTSGLGVSSTTILQADTWYHICGVLGNNYMAFYVNGNRETYSTIDSSSITYTNADYFRVGTINSGNLFRGKLNDVRYYDHALSQMEVKELAKGLVLHYPLNRQGWGQENLLKNSKVNKNTSSGSADGGEVTQTIPNGTTITISIRVDADNITWDSSANYRRLGTEISLPKATSGTQYVGVWAGKDLSAGANVVESFTGSFHGRISKTFTLEGDLAATKHAYMYIQGVSSGTFNISDIKLEIGSKTTPWCPNSSDILATTMGLNSTTEYDCSGFCNNGTRTGAFTWISDTPKYAVSTAIEKGIITSANSFTTVADPIFSVALWFKLKSEVTYTAYTDLISFSSSSYSSQPFRLELCGSPVGKTIMWFRGPSGQSGGFTVKSDLSFDTWYHTVLVSEGNKQYSYYVNGEKLGTYNGSANSWTPTGNVSLGENINGAFYESDFRIYATALSADDVKSLYQNSAYIDNSGNVYGTIHEV